MKRGLFFLIIMLLPICAQQDLSSSVNVKDIVKQQIEEAKKKELAQEEKKDQVTTIQEEIQAEENKAKSPEIEVPVVKENTTVKSETIYSNAIIFINKNSDVLRYLVLALFSTIILSYVAIRRTKLNKQKPEPQVKVSDDIKTNIKLVREEKFIKPIDPNLKKIRTNLCLTSKYLNTSEQVVTETAKKYNLAKTEIMLAAKFRNQTAIPS